MLILFIAISTAIILADEYANNSEFRSRVNNLAQE